MKQLEKEESTFLSICNPHDRALASGKEKMTLQEFERITYLTMVLNYVEYTIALHKRYMDFTIKLTEKMDRENEILKEYPNYYLDEKVEEKKQKWIDDFYNNIPTDKQKNFKARLKPQI